MNETKKELAIACNLPPGDICILSAAVKSLHDKYPKTYKTAVLTQYPQIFKNNPNISEVNLNTAQVIKINYQEISNVSNHVPVPFLFGFVTDLGKKLGIPLTLTTNKPALYLNPSEQRWKSPIGKPYWIINAGIDNYFTTKQWLGYQQVVNHFKNKIQFVQIGKSGDNHPKLANVIDLIGKTSLRELIIWISKCTAAIGSITLIQHLCAAFDKPYFCIAGGRENSTWIQYPKQQTFHTIGQLECCKHGGCWFPRTVALNDSHEFDLSLCKNPITKDPYVIPKCMDLIKPVEVILAIERFLNASS